MYSRRCFMKAGLRSLTVASSLPALAQALEDLEPGARAHDRHPRRRCACVIDVQTCGDPAFDVAEAIDAGFTGLVVDVQAYPRTFENAVHGVAEWNYAISRPGSRLRKVLRRKDLALAQDRDQLGIILSCQDGSILDASTGSVTDYNLQNLLLFYDLGMRMLSLTHNERNALGDSFRESSDAGLSHLGCSVVESMNELGMIVELSHCGDRTTMAAIEQSTRPCMITHAGCRALHPSQRNKTDEEIRALADRGGLFGVFNMANWLTKEDRASVDTVAEHIVHAVNVGGVDHVAFGSDGPPLRVEDLEQELEGIQEWCRKNTGLPGARTIPAQVRVEELNCPERMWCVADALKARGFNRDFVEKIIGGNFCRVFREVCG